MRIAKAIEILDNHQCDMPRDSVPDLIAAVQLGIEALKYINEWRIPPHGGATILLPGETQEDE